ncbi:MAG: flagellar export chaperone FliS [Candidatus Dormibacteraceae bacterium]
MAANVPNPYLQAEVLSADPVKLVQLLYRGAIDAVVTARRHLAAGEIRQRSKSITKAWEILLELIRSLDHSHGGDLSRNLASLYIYMQKRLMEANSLQSDRQLQEVEALLSTLLDGWQQVTAHHAPVPASVPVPSAPAYPASAEDHRERLSFTY